MQASFNPPQPSSLYLLFKSGALAATVAVAGMGILVSGVCAEPPTLVESQTTVTAGKPVLVVSESGKTQTIEAEGQDVSIDGNKNDITLHGKCHALTVSGNQNTVHAGALVSISTPGNKNAITWTQAASGEKPQITDVGSGNSIEHSPK